MADSLGSLFLVGNNFGRESPAGYGEGWGTGLMKMLQNQPQKSSIPLGDLAATGQQWRPKFR
jgi:hypothetical protein